MTRNEALEVLIAYAERRSEIVHANNGLCPDEYEGHDTRDPECVICRALLVVKK